MDIFAVKLLMFVVIFLFGLGGGILPRIFRKTKYGGTILLLGSAFSGGVFLGAGMIHLFGDSHEFFAAAIGEHDYPYFLMVGGVGFLLILLIEKVLVRVEEADAAKSANPYILMAVLSAHSFIAGTALGLESAISGALVLLFAILAHKSFAAFALGISFIEARLSKDQYYSLLIFFSIMTPLGVLLGALLNNILHSQTALELEAIFDGLAGGTFIYVASMEVISRSFEQHKMRRGKYIAIALGYAMMALLAIWA